MPCWRSRPRTLPTCAPMINNTFQPDVDLAERLVGGCHAGEASWRAANPGATVARHDQPVRRGTRHRCSIGVQALPTPVMSLLAAAAVCCICCGTSKKAARLIVSSLGLILIIGGRVHAALRWEQRITLGSRPLIYIAIAVFIDGGAGRAERVGCAPAVFSVHAATFIVSLMVSRRLLLLWHIRVAP